ncbi:excinuclease [Shewanella livingstonensis]|uniref:Excinuclease n=1 Tax=Shewanella livingstonensis TaxID=150120 RepID=A0A3G8LU78_9GAMM|nr:excinuclease [Shewanella livingstonensis]AZG72785.1 excinuclease [Shewanella livingstonensis]
MKHILAAIILVIFLIPATSYARDDIASYSVADAMDSEQAKNKLGSDIVFYFGDQAHSEPQQQFGEFKSNKKTNAFNKTDLEACQWVFLSAMISLKERAIKEGGNAVVAIKSNYKNNLSSSNDTFQCGAGTFVAGVALTGNVVKL